MSVIKKIYSIILQIESKLMIFYVKTYFGIQQNVKMGLIDEIL